MPIEVETHIKGAFKGWTGKTTFELENGQVWQQTAYAYHYHYAYRPEITIFDDGGGYEMKVEGIDDTIQVKRLK